MKEVEIKIKNSFIMYPTIEIDGKIRKLKKNEFGSLVYRTTTENDVMDVKIYKFLEINGVGWFFAYMFFYIISIFGILQPKYDRKCIVIDCHYKIKLEEKNDITITLNKISEDNAATTIETSCEYEELSNRYSVDHRAKLKLKIMSIAKIFIAIAMIALLILLVDKVIIGN